MKYNKICNIISILFFLERNGLNQHVQSGASTRPDTLDLHVGRPSVLHYLSIVLPVAAAGQSASQSRPRGAAPCLAEPSCGGPWTKLLILERLER